MNIVRYAIVIGLVASLVIASVISADPYPWTFCLDTNDGAVCW